MSEKVRFIILSILLILSIALYIYVTQSSENTLLQR